MRTWIEAQNKLTFDYLGRIPERKPIKDRLRKVWNYERFGIPEKKGSRYFWTKNDGLQNQSVLYWATSLKGTPKVLLDPNKLSKDGTVALSAISISHDGKYLAYAVASGGSDWQEWRVRRVDTGADLPDRVRWSKFSGASWTKDNKGFYYSRYDAPKPGQELEAVNYFHKLYYHRINSGQEKDSLIYERKDKKEWGFDGRVTDDGRYLLITVWEGTKRENRVFYKDLGLRSSKVVELLKTADASYGFIGNSGTKFWFQTDLKTPRGRVIEIDIKKPETKYWKTILPEAKEKLESVSHVGRRLVAQYLKDAHSVVKVYSTVGKLVREVKLPVLGSAGGFGGKYTDTTTFFDFQSFAFPSRRVFLRDLDRQDGSGLPVQGRCEARRLRNQANLLPQQGRDARSDVLGVSQGPQARRGEPHAAVGLRRVQHLADALFLCVQAHLGTNGRCACDRQHPRRG